MIKELHSLAQEAAARFKKAEADLIDILQKLDACKGFRDLGYPSLFAYVQRGLGLSEACTQALISVSRAAVRVPELKMAIREGEITVSKAKSLAAVITPANQASWLQLAREVPTRALERAVAEERPEVALREKVRPVGGEKHRLEASVSSKGLADLERARELLAQKLGRAVNLGEVVEWLAGDFVRRQDPVRKAERSKRSTVHVNGKSIPATVAHQVHRRDRGRCQFRLPDGKICAAGTWLHLHHKIPRAEGGQHAASNLLTLCAAHHRIVHDRPPH